MSRMKRWLYGAVAGLLTLAPGGAALAATTVGNNVSVGGTHTVTGATTLSTVTSTNATSSGYLDVGSISSSNANWGAGSLNVGNRLSVDGATYVSSTLDVTGNSRFYGTLTVDTGFISSASSSIGSHLQVGGLLNASSTILIGSATNQSVSSTLISNEALRLGLNSTTFASGFFFVDGTVGGNGNVFTSGTLRATGLGTFGGVSSTIVSSSQHMSVGVIDGSNSNFALGSLNVGNRLSVDGATYVSSTLDVTGNSRFYGTLTIDGLSTLATVTSTIVTTSLYLSTGVIDSSNSSFANGSLNVGNRLSVDGATYVSSTLDVTGAIQSYGNLTIGIANANASSTLTVNGTSTITGPVIIATSSLNSPPGFTVAPTTTFFNSVTIGNAQTSGAILTIGFLVGSSIIPNASTYDLGAFNTGNGATVSSWRDLYVSNTAYSGSSSIFNTTATATLYIKSGGTGLGGRIIFEDAVGTACVQLTIGRNGDFVTSTVTCPPL